ncbi:MAG: zinc-ribbon domain-containing protein [Candidatus Lokiarchaeota archaeon]|nr:zinc-ribbon domain-containing protein [Candidatus Lokiarchaeota archaeon]
MNCPNCGVQINDLSVKFCETCGTELILNKVTNTADDRNILKTSSRRKRCC